MPYAADKIRSRRTARRWRPGNAIIEAALVLPILLSLSFGTVEFAHFFYIKHTLQGAARDGARTAIIPSATATSVQNAIGNSMNAAGLPPAKYTVDIRNPVTDQVVDVATVESGTAIKVTVTCVWSEVGLRPLNLIAASKPVVGFTVMVKE